MVSRCYVVTGTQRHSATMNVCAGDSASQKNSGEQCTSARVPSIGTAGFGLLGTWVLLLACSAASEQWDLVRQCHFPDVCHWFKCTLFSCPSSHPSTKHALGMTWLETDHQKALVSPLR